MALAPHFASKGITVNAVSLGITAIDMNEDILATPEGRAGAAALSAFTRMGTTEDVADIVVFVASEEAGFKSKFGNKLNEPINQKLFINLIKKVEKPSSYGVSLYYYTI